MVLMHCLNFLQSGAKPQTLAEQCKALILLEFFHVSPHLVKFPISNIKPLILMSWTCLPKEAMEATDLFSALVFHQFMLCLYHVNTTTSRIGLRMGL